MIAKKSSKADLENKRFAFFQIGMIVAGSLTLAAFEYTTVQTEKEKVAVVENEGLTIIYEPAISELEAERPEPTHNDRQAAIQMMPVDELHIVTRPIDPNAILTSQSIHVGEPCTDCGGDIWIEGPEEGEITEIPEKEPMFPGGDLAMAKFIQEKTEYPATMADMGVGGVAYVQFVVNTDGSICQVTTISDVPKELKAEAERVVKSMPNWTPGEQAGKAVRVRYVVPINFQVRNN